MAFRKKVLVGFVVAAGLVGQAQAASLSLTSHSGSVGAGADATVFGFDPDGGFLSDSWAGEPKDLSIVFQAVSRGTVGIAAATAIVDASWAMNGLSGRVATSHNWVFQTGGEQGFTARLRRPSWTYSFTPSVDALFTLNYASATEFQKFGLLGYNIVVNGDDTSLLGPNLNPDTQGVFKARLRAGIEHDLELYTGSNIAILAPDGFVGFQTGDFSFTLSAVPEPATWALMIAGFGTVGAMMRSHRRRATA